jgi:hypothetical protein
MVEFHVVGKNGNGNEKEKGRGGKRQTKIIRAQPFRQR